MTDIGRKGENEYVRDFEKKCRKNTFFCVAIPIVIGIALLTITKLGVISLLLGPEKIQGEVDYEALENKYVTFDMKYVLERFGEKKVKSKKTNKTTTSRIYYIIYNEEDDTVFGLDMLAYQSSKMNKRIDDTWDWIDDRIDDVEDSMTVTGTLKKMTPDMLKNYQEVCSEIIEDGYEDMAVTYYIEYDSINGFSTMMVWFLSAVAVVCFGYAIYILITRDKSKYDEEVKVYLQKNPYITMAELESDFRSAKNIGNSVYVGQRWTFYVEKHRIQLLENDSLVWAYYVYRQEKPTISCVRTYDKNKVCRQIPVSRILADILLDYYKEHYPHIIIGYDREKEEQFHTNFPAFISQGGTISQVVDENRNWEDRYGI